MKIKRLAQFIVTTLLVTAIVIPATGCETVKKKFADKDPFVMAIQELDGVFSPFFGTSGYDTEVSGMTQVSMVSIDGQGNIDVGEHTPSVALDYTVNTTDNRDEEEKNNTGEIYPEKYYTDYEFLIKNGMKFSDGVDLTIKDVLFNMYVYLDPVYTGSSTMYSTSIQGMNAYRTQIPTAQDGESSSMDENYLRLAEDRVKAVYLYLPDDNKEPEFDPAFEGQIKEDINTAAALFKEEMDSLWNACSSGLEDVKEDYKVGNDYLVTETWQYFLIATGLVVPETDPNDSAKITAIDFSNYKSRVEAAADKKAFCVNLPFVNYFGADFGSTEHIENMDLRRGIRTVLSSWSTASTFRQEIANELKTEYFEENRGKVPSMKGITTGTVTSFNGTTFSEQHSVLKIRINGVDPKAIFNFGFTVAPMHYYSNPKAGSNFTSNDGYLGFKPEEGHYGFPMGNSDYFNNVIKPVYGVPVGAGAYQASNKNSEKDYNKISATGSSDGFHSDGIVYYIRNENFNTMGKEVENAIIEKVRYQVTASNKLFEAVKTQAVDWADPSAKTAVMTELNSPKTKKTFKYIAVRNNGYGYIGVSARFVPDILIRQAIMHAIDIAQIKAYYFGNTAENIYVPMSKVSWAYPETATSPYYDSTKNGAFHDETAIEIIKDLVYKAGYIQSATRNGLQVKYREIRGQRHYLEYPFTIAGSDTDHPAFTAMQSAKVLLEKCGFSIKVATDSQALKKLPAGELTVWAAAWSSTIDPDMYQVYHMDSKATSINGWGYPQLLGLGTNERTGTDQEVDLIADLSKLIEDGRSTNVQAERKPIYAQALKLVMDLAVELPTYQRSNIYVYYSSMLDESTFNPDPTPYKGVLAEIWKLDFAK